ncbi:MAG: hypothetical protein AAF358_20540 [Pseudomonadota bacterium]
MSQRKLNHYVTEFAERLRRRQRNDGLAVLAAVALGFSLLAVFWLVRNGFPEAEVGALRIGGVLLLAVLGYVLLWRPLRRPPDSAEQAKALEERAPFDGRLETWAGTPSDNPLRPLLADDALTIAREHAPDALLSSKRLNVPAALAGLCVVGLLVLLAGGAGLFGYGMRHLWGGWLIPDLLPPQSIVVTPGDTLVRRGGRLLVEAKAEGFSPAAAEVFARRAGGDWQSTGMRELAGAEGPDGESSPDRFGFTFPAVREALEYYVQAGGVRSPTFNAEVIALPRITDFSMTYRYPLWTRRESETIRPGGDIKAIAGTEVALEVTTDAPLPGAAVVLAGSSTPMTLDGSVARGTLTVAEDEEYYLAAVVGGDQVRLTENFLIRALEDQAPALSFASPARDLDAHALEEIPLNVTAEDDFGLEDLTLHIAVNGGPFTEHPLLEPAAAPAGESASGPDEKARRSHLLMLETLADGAYLRPGDVVSYYASARDRESEAESDLFFVSIKPFDRRVSQSQMAGGQSGPGNQDEISQRQREIILSTWNLRRQEKDLGDDETPAGDEETLAEANGAEPASDAPVASNPPAGALADKASLLSDLQATLAAQATSLAERARARQLSAADDDIARYIGHLDDAVVAMEPAIEQLRLGEFELAMAPEQEALQHLLRAESVFTDIAITTSSNAQGSGSGSDLAEMMELELDLEKNQYETASQASPQQPGQSEDETLDALEDLARRQQALADAMNSAGGPTPAQRWQQERLQREVEELLEQLRGRPSDGQSQSQSQAQAQSQSQSGSSGSQQQSSSSEMPQSGEPSLEERLEQAAEAMAELNRSGQPPGGEPQGSSGEDASNSAQASNDNSAPAGQPAGGENGAAGSDVEAARQALAQLQAARDEALQRQAQTMEETFDGLTDQAQALLDEQSELAETLDTALREAMEKRGDEPNRLSSNGRPESGLTPMQEYELATQKRRLGQDLQTLQQDMLEAAQQFDEASPEGSQALREGVAELDRSEAIVRLGVAAEYIEYGAAAYIVSTEDLVTNAMRSLRDNAADAARRAGRSAAQGRGALDEALAELSQLRRDLQALAEGSAEPGAGPLGQEPGQQTGQTPGQQAGEQPGQQPGQQSGEQPGQQPGRGAFGDTASSEPGEQPGPGQSAGDRGGAETRLADAGGQPGGPDSRGGLSNPYGAGAGSSPAGATFQPRRASAALQPAEAQQMLNDRADGVADSLSDALPSLAGRRVSEEELRELRELLGEFDLASLTGDTALLDAELSRLLRLAENLEIGVRTAVRANREEQVRSMVPRQVAPEYRDAVSDYYQELGERSGDTSGQPQ